MYIHHNTSCLSSFLHWHYSDDNFLYYLFPFHLDVFCEDLLFLLSYIWCIFIFVQAFDIAFFFSIGYVDLGGEGYVLSLLLQPRFPNTWKTNNRLYLVVLKWIALSKFYGWWNIFWKSCVADSSPITFPGLTGIPSCYKYMSRVTPHPPKLSYVSPVVDCPVSCKLWHMICYQKLWTWLLYRSWGS